MLSKNDEERSTHRQRVRKMPHRIRSNLAFSGGFGSKSIHEVMSGTIRERLAIDIDADRAVARAPPWGGHTAERPVSTRPATKAHISVNSSLMEG